MKLYDKQGNIVMELISINREQSDLLLKARVMNALVTNIYLRPADLWNLKSFLSWSIILYVPIMVFKGFIGCKSIKTLKKWIGHGNG